MSSLAIDIVIILPRKIQEEIIELNKRLTGDDENFSQNLVDYVPHITILMGYIEEGNLPEAKERLKNYIHGTQMPSIQAIGIGTFTLPNGGLWQYIDIDSEKSLQNLYDYVVDMIKPLMHYDAKKEYFYDGEKINEITLDWTYRHKERKKGEIYIPHISIGLGNRGSIEYTKAIKSVGIGIYQLGNYCTCRKKLF